MVIFKEAFPKATRKRIERFKKFLRKLRDTQISTIEEVVLEI